MLRRSSPTVIDLETLETLSDVAPPPLVADDAPPVATISDEVDAAKVDPYPAASLTSTAVADSAQPPPRHVQELTSTQFTAITRGLSSLAASSTTILRTAAPLDEGRSRSPHRRRVDDGSTTADDGDVGQRYIMFDCRVVELLRQMTSSEIRNMMTRALHNQANDRHGEFALTDFALGDEAHTRIFWQLSPVPAGVPKNRVALVSARDPAPSAGEQA